GRSLGPSRASVHREPRRRDHSDERPDYGRIGRGRGIAHWRRADDWLVWVCGKRRKVIGGCRLAAVAWTEPSNPPRRIVVAFCFSGARDWPARGHLCALLHVGARSGTAVLLVFSRLYGLDARAGAIGQPYPDGLFLGADQPLFLPPHRLLASQRK